VRDHLVERWMKTTRAQLRAGRQARLLPVDGVPHRPHLGNAMLALELAGTVRQALVELDVDPD
jgi:starch phosphorylase